ncbi:Os08g0294300 [Oryza sativa Japonica Group]|uniref:Os08g0294300 protein n=1 Tax=Oryza sativa subsp. japonica TaxID=39947 RepID=Q6ZJA6_ORYSJ|nr:hypothetical protein DAI22_08g105400 [Oryza sativa Japonica Group]BAD01213.1 unknown protein [Oryza sativa Japonica Group]BAF23387.1 Os08g0294300 [Oryza sativa Japonica Group]|eukprot:NP_001061473.1 Os08g0294300 [Oryza sativa Japonica Group]
MKATQVATIILLTKIQALDREVGAVRSGASGTRTSTTAHRSSALAPAIQSPPTRCLPHSTASPPPEKADARRRTWKRCSSGPRIWRPNTTGPQASAS